MGAGLFGFIFNTLRPRVNDPRNAKFWLPKKLQDLDKPHGGGKMLPIQGTDWKLGNITGTTGSTFQKVITDQWWLGAVGLKHRGDPEMANHQPIACPADPWPQLALPEATIDGLENLWLLPDPDISQPGTGYHCVITFQCGYYQGQGDLPTLSQLRVVGKYALTQCVCSAPATQAGEPSPTACDDWVPRAAIRGLGDLTVTLTDVFIDAALTMTVVGSGPGRTLQVAVDTITVRGPEPGQLPNLVVDNLTVETQWEWMANAIWLPQAKRAIESPDGTRGLIDNLDASLNESDNRTKLGAQLTAQINTSTERILGTIGSGGLPSDAGQQASNPVDQYFFDRLRVAVNAPDSGYYLPKVVSCSNDPPLEPYDAGTITLGDQAVEGIPFQNCRCMDVTITGFSNVLGPANQLILTPAQIDATLNLSTIGSPTIAHVPKPPLTITGIFSFEAEGMPAMTGGLTITVIPSRVRAMVQTAGQDLDQLVLTFEKLELQAEFNALTISVDIDSMFKSLIDQVVNRDDIKSKILGSINARLSQHLGGISQSATRGVRTSITSALDG
jgi:hypothetical protein